VRNKSEVSGARKAVQETMKCSKVHDPQRIYSTAVNTTDVDLNKHAWPLLAFEPL
jgi:hypothetical protein